MKNPFGRVGPDYSNSTIRALVGPADFIVKNK